MERGVPARLSPSEGRKFAFTVGIAFAVLAGVVIWRGHDGVATGLGVVSAALLLAGVVVPGKLGPVYRAWMGLALLISKVTTPIFMGLTYFVVIAPVGVVMRMIGRNPMTHSPVDGSLWASRPDGPTRRSDLERQF